MGDNGHKGMNFTRKFMRSKSMSRRNGHLSEIFTKDGQPKYELLLYEQ